jgi:transcriptional regulator with GAF, ATPase, and Fis domain
MENETEMTTVPYLERESDKKIFPLSGRLTTIGSSTDCRIVLAGNGVPLHMAHILFTGGVFTLSVINRNPATLRNGTPVITPVSLSDNDKLLLGNECFHFRNTVSDKPTNSTSESSPLRRFITALSSFMRTGDSDARFELLSGIAQFLLADGARLVIENQNGEFVTFARFPQTSGLDRFSQRAILWAKQKAVTILMHDSDWQEDKDSKGSLEINSIGSILCRPLFEGKTIRGYLYLDKKRGRETFSEKDREILDDVGPVFDDLLAFYDRSTRQRETIERLQKSLELQSAPVIFECTAMQAAIELSVKFAATDSTMLVTGETGTGKELFARFIHHHSRRSGKDFCAINCGALPENLIESELFGHEKGAFTGAYQKKIGLFERADGGTVFLDEIGEMPLNLQVKLLRVLQESEINPIGSTETVRIDVRLIAATNRDLRTEVKNGRFREDLLYRLNVLEIVVPPLRDRHRDALLLTDYFIKKYAQRFGLQEKGLALQAQAKILAYSWPGNVRQLENIIQKALLVSKGNLIVDDDIHIEERAEKQNVSDAVSGQTLKDARAAAELQCIKNALAKANGNVSMAARLLDVDRKWLTKLMKTYNIAIERNSDSVISNR